MAGDVAHAMVAVMAAREVDLSAPVEFSYFFQPVGHASSSQPTAAGLKVGLPVETSRTTRAVIYVDRGEASAVLASQLLASTMLSDGSTPVGIGELLDTSNVHVRVDGDLVWIDWIDPELPASFEFQTTGVSDSIETALVTLQSHQGTHGPMSAKQDEHAALLNVFPRDQATAIAVNDGPWSAAATWNHGQAPASGSKVLVPEGVDITFDLADSPTLNWIRVDGGMSWATDKNTRLTVETLMVNSTGSFQLGNEDNPISADVSAEILIDTSGGAINQAVDPTLVSRGLILHGTTRIHGAEKTDKVTLAQDASAGSSTLTLSREMTDWQVGDRVLLPGTFTDHSLPTSQFDAADAKNARFHDEILEITSIDGDQIRFINRTDPADDSPGNELLWDHVRPDGETFDPDELSLYVANLSRNVIVRSSDAGVDHQERGHVMIMHNPDADIRYAQFKDLGRSDKRLTVDDPGENFDGSPGGGTNPRGRYGLHLHRVGADGYDSPAANVVGNVVWGTPGWGIVQHDSHAMLRNNIVFDVAGAGIVAENGNEIGEWSGNLVVKATGDLVNNFDDNAFFLTKRGPRFDLGFFGSGYWVQGGGFGILMTDNVAASINGSGFDLLSSHDGMVLNPRVPVSLIADEAIRQEYVSAGYRDVLVSRSAMRGMSGVAVYNSFRGIHSWAHNRNSISMEGSFVAAQSGSHDFDSLIDDYKLWNVQSGVQHLYSSRIRLENGLVIGNVEVPVPFKGNRDGNNARGIGLSHNRDDANRIDYQDLRVEGFEYGFQTFNPLNTNLNELTPYAVSFLSDASFANVRQAFVSDIDHPAYAEPFSELFQVKNVSSSSASIAPLAKFEHASAGAYAVSFDATNSMAQSGGSTNGIVGYAWDMDNDGQFDDAFGASPQYTFQNGGEQTVSLMVWDAQAASHSVQTTFKVDYVPIDNLLSDSNFTSPRPGQMWWATNENRRDGWGELFFQFEDGVARNAPVPWKSGNLTQVAQDDHRVQGVIELAFDAKHVSTYERGEVRVILFGVDGQFRLQGSREGIQRHQLLAQPRSERLIDRNVLRSDADEWDRVSIEADVGNGFEYYVVQFVYRGRDASRGDLVAFKDIVLAPRSIEIQPSVDAIQDVVVPSTSQAFSTNIHGASMASQRDIWTDPSNCTDCSSADPIGVISESYADDEVDAVRVLPVVSYELTQSPSTEWKNADEDQGLVMLADSTSVLSQRERSSR